MEAVTDTAFSHPKKADAGEGRHTAASYGAECYRTIEPPPQVSGGLTFSVAWKLFKFYHSRRLLLCSINSAYEICAHTPRQIQYHLYTHPKNRSPLLTFNLTRMLQDAYIRPSVSVTP